MVVLIDSLHKEVMSFAVCVSMIMGWMMWYLVFCFFEIFFAALRFFCLSDARTIKIVNLKF